MAKENVGRRSGKTFDDHLRKEAHVSYKEWKDTPESQKEYMRWVYKKKVERRIHIEKRIKERPQRRSAEKEARVKGSSGTSGAKGSSGEGGPVSRDQQKRRDEAARRAKGGPIKKGGHLDAPKPYSEEFLSSKRQKQAEQIADYEKKGSIAERLKAKRGSKEKAQSRPSKTPSGHSGYRTIGTSYSPGHSGYRPIGTKYSSGPQAYQPPGTKFSPGSYPPGSYSRAQSGAAGIKYYAALTKAWKSVNKHLNNFVKGYKLSGISSTITGSKAAGALGTLGGAAVARIPGMASTTTPAERLANLYSAETQIGAQALGVGIGWAAGGPVGAMIGQAIADAVGQIGAALIQTIFEDDKLIEKTTINEVMQTMMTSEREGTPLSQHPGQDPNAIFKDYVRSVKRLATVLVNDQIRANDEISAFLEDKNEVEAVETLQGEFFSMGGF